MSQYNTYQAIEMKSSLVGTSPWPPRTYRQTFSSWPTSDLRLLMHIPGSLSGVTLVNHHWWASLQARAWRKVISSLDEGVQSSEAAPKE